MAKRKRMSTDEVWKEWEADPEIARHLAERSRRHEKRVEDYRVAVQPVVADLNRQGFEGATIQEIVRSHSPLPNELVEALLSWIPRVENRGIKDELIRSLAGESISFDGQVLIEEFEKDKLEGLLRWPIANTIATSNVKGIGDWLATTVRKPVQGREMLVLALARHVPSEVSLPILRSMLDVEPGHVALVLRTSKIGGIEELLLLEARLPVVAKTWVKKEFEKAIRAIRRRVEKSKK